MKIEDALAAIWAMYLIQIGTGNAKTAEKIKSIHDAINSEIDRLTRELEAAQRDAGRYQFLRDGDKSNAINVYKSNWHTKDLLFSWELDEAIDAAIAKANN
jgi:hypothetical protein